MRKTVFAFVIGVIAGASAPLNAQCSQEIQQQITARDYDAVHAALSARLKTAPNDDVTIDCMGRALLAEGKSGKAVDWLERAIKINGNSAYHHDALGKALMEEGMKASIFRRPFVIRRLRTEYETAVALDPTLVDARRGLVMFYSMAPGAMGGSIDKAREHAEAILKLNPMRGHTALGFIAERRKDIPGAEKEFLAAIALHPDSIAPYLAAGAFYHRQKRIADSISMYQKLLVLDPKNEDAKKELATLIREGK